MCGRQVTVDKINKHTRICSDHFPINEVLDPKFNQKLDPIPIFKIGSKVSVEELDFEYNFSENFSGKTYSRLVNTVGKNIENLSKIKSLITDKNLQSVLDKIIQDYVDTSTTSRLPKQEVRICTSLLSQNTVNIDMNNFDMEASKILLDENHEILQIKEPLEELWETTKTLISHRNKLTGQQILQDLTSSFISQYNELDKNQKKVVLTKLAINKYVQLDDLKKKFSEIKDSESLMKNELELRKLFDPPYKWLFSRVSKMPENGFKTLEKIQKDLLDMFLDVPNMSSLQKIAIKTMRDHVTSVVKSVINNEVANIPSTTVYTENHHNKQVIIDENLYIRKPFDISKSKTPVCDFIYRDQGGAEFYTGFNKIEQESLWNLLGNDKNKLDVWGRRPGFKNSEIRDLSIECQFLLCLMILRRNKTYTKCSYLFKVCPNIISAVFKTWLAFIIAKFKDFEAYCRVSRKNLKLPAAFKNRFLRNIRFVMDCTEFKCESTKDYGRQGNNYSDYKKGTTKKALIAVLPNGFAAFVSGAAEGSMSDREITKRSGFLNLLEEGDEILADRGFTIEDLVLEKKAKLKIPPFLRGRKKFTYKELVQSRLITRARHSAPK